MHATTDLPSDDSAAGAPIGAHRMSDPPLGLGYYRIIRQPSLRDGSIRFTVEVITADDANGFDYSSVTPVLVDASGHQTELTALMPNRWETNDIEPCLVEPLELRWKLCKQGTP